MVFSYDPSVSARQRLLIMEAIRLCTYPLDMVDADVTFEVVAEPSCPGHKDYMCTTETVTGSHGAATVEIREGADDAKAPVNYTNGRTTEDQVVKFFQESIIHELGHCVTFIFINDDSMRTTAATYFYKSGPTGTGNAQGALADWDPLTSPWEDRIQEAVAEVFKDTYLDDRHRLYENRTNWAIDANNHALLMQMLLPPNTYGAYEGYLPMHGESGAFAAPPLSTTDGGTYPTEAWTDWFPIAEPLSPGSTPFYTFVDPLLIVQRGPLEGYDGQDPLKFLLQFGTVTPPKQNIGGVLPPPFPTIQGGAWDWDWFDGDTLSSGDVHLHPSANYTVSAKLSDKRNGVIYQYDASVAGVRSNTLVREDIRPKHPLDVPSLEGRIEIRGTVPVWPLGFFGVETVGANHRSTTADFEIRGTGSSAEKPSGIPAELSEAYFWGLFAYPSKNVRSQLPPYPYQPASVNAQAKALNAVNLADATTALR